MKKLPKVPRGLKSTLSKLEKRVEREKLIADRKKEIEAMKKKVLTLRNKLR